MSYGRVTTVEFNSEQDAEELKDHYRENASSTFPDAQMMISIQTGPTTAVAVSIYPTKGALDASNEARDAMLEGYKASIKSVETHEGEVNLAFTR
tara:strand:+ start:85 stop:369 length:285 start_codon:yes stop_codon:yes gene_type:complete